MQSASRDGVLIYQGDRVASLEEISHTHWVREEMAYVPDFIVLDEQGEVKEIWFESDEREMENKDKRNASYEKEKEKTEYRV